MVCLVFFSLVYVVFRRGCGLFEHSSSMCYPRIVKKRIGLNFKDSLYIKIQLLVLCFPFPHLTFLGKINSISKIYNFKSYHVKDYRLSIAIITFTYQIFISVDPNFIRIVEKVSAFWTYCRNG